MLLTALGVVAAGLLFILAGIVFFLRPEWIWKLTEQWKSYRAEEPSDLYRISIKASGIVLAVVGVALMVLSFVWCFLPG